MFEDPSTSDHCLPPAPFQQEVHCVSLPIDIPPPDMRIRHLHHAEQVSTEIVRISGRHAQGCRKQPRFVFPFVVQRVEAIVTQLAQVDNCTVSVWDGHTARVRFAQYR